MTIKRFDAQGLRVNSSRIAAANYRSIEELMRELDTIRDEVNVAKKELQETRSLLHAHGLKETAGSMMFSIDQTDIKKSPPASSAADLKVSVKDLSGIQKNFATTHRLHDLMQSLDVMEAKMKASFGKKSEEFQRAEREIAVMRKSVTDELGVAFSFLNGMAQSYAPAEFIDFVDAIARMCERSIAYEDVSNFIYLFEDDGRLIFSHYLQLKNCTDEDGSTFPSLFVITSMTATAPKEFFLNTATEFSPPSAANLVSRVASPKDAVLKLNVLLHADGFDSNLASMPVPLLLSKQDLKKERFNSAEYISSLGIDEDTGAVYFYLKPTVKDRALVQQIASQLYVDMQGVVKTTRSRLRMSPPKKLSKNILITFYMEKPAGAPKALPDDLDFLKTRFGIADSSINRILKIVNATFDRAPTVQP